MKQLLSYLLEPGVPENIGVVGYVAAVVGNRKLLHSLGLAAKTHFTSGEVDQKTLCSWTFCGQVSNP